MSEKKVPQPVEIRWSPAGDYVWVFQRSRYRDPIFEGTPQDFATWALVEKYGDTITTVRHYDEEHDTNG